VHVTLGVGQNEINAAAADSKPSHDESGSKRSDQKRPMLSSLEEGTTKGTVITTRLLLSTSNI
jgi:hypothetical protein